MWSLPDTYNLIYLDAQIENRNARNIVSNILSNLLGRNVPIKYARRIGRKKHGHNRPILIRLNFYDDVMEIIRASQGSCYCFRKFQVKTPSDLEKVHTNNMKCLSLSISTPAVYVSMESLIDSRLPIELGPWQLNTGCESPLEHRTGYWMRHIKPLFMRNIIGCSAFRPYWILMDLVMFGLTHSLLVLLFTNCLKRAWKISSNRKGEANYSSQVDLTHWIISLKTIVKNQTYKK